MTFAVNEWCALRICVRGDVATRNMVGTVFYDLNLMLCVLLDGLSASFRWNPPPATRDEADDDPDDPVIGPPLLRVRVLIALTCPPLLRVRIYSRKIWGEVLPKFFRGFGNYGGVGYSADFPAGLLAAQPNVAGPAPPISPSPHLVIAAVFPPHASREYMPPRPVSMRLRGGAPTPTTPASFARLLLLRFAVGHQLRRTHPSDMIYDALLARFRFLTSLLDVLRARARLAALCDALNARVWPSSLTVPSTSRTIPSSSSLLQPATATTSIALSEVTATFRAAHPSLCLPGSPLPSDDDATQVDESHPARSDDGATQVDSPLAAAAAAVAPAAAASTVVFDGVASLSDVAPSAPAVPSLFGASTQLFEDEDYGAEAELEDFGEEEVESVASSAAPVAPPPPAQEQPPPPPPPPLPQPPHPPPPQPSAATFHAEWCERCGLGRSTPPTEAGRQRMQQHRECPRCGWDLDDDWAAAERRAYDPDLGTGGTCLGCGAVQRPFTGCLGCGAPVDPDDGSVTYYFGEWLTHAQIEQLERPAGYGTDDNDDDDGAADAVPPPLAGDGGDGAPADDDPAPAGQPGPHQW